MKEVHQQDWMEKWAIYSPDKIAVKEYETQRTLTYAQLNNAGGHIAAYLKNELNLAKGDRVAVLAEHCLEYVALFSAAQKSGDRKSTRLNSSHVRISYAVFCLKKK